jgi:uncharacterized ubiquitin-like protein YukD
MNFKLDKEYFINVTYEVLEKIEEIGVDLRTINKNLPIKILVDIVYASISVSHPEMTRKQVGDLLFQYSNKPLILEVALYIMTKLIPFYTGMTEEEFEEVVKKETEKLVNNGEEPKNEVPEVEPEKSIFLPNNSDQTL